MAADVVGFSALMAVAEETTLRRVIDETERASREISRNHGRVFSMAGDGLMAEFPSAVEALKCALRIQASVAKRQHLVPSSSGEILFRIGLNAGEVVIEGDRVGGTTVNVAARLEALAEPGGIALSEGVLQQVRRVVTADYQFLGRPALKNITDPPPVYMVPRVFCAAWAGLPALQRQTASAGAADPAKEYRPSLAVLPFRTLQKSEDDAYFAEGIVEDVIRALGTLKDLIVISRSSTQIFAGSPLDLRRVGHDLDVRYVIHGSVRKARNSLRIAVELNEAQSGAVIWVERFDGEMGDLFELQDRIALRVAQSVAPHLRKRELDHALRKRPESLTAYDLTLRALDLFQSAEQAALDRAGALLKQSIAVDPGYGPAYSHLAALQMRIIGQGWSADPVADSAIAADYAQLSLERDRNDAVALAICGHVQSFLFRRYQVATEYLERAIAAGPNCALAWGLSSLTSGYTGKHAKSVSQAEWALRLCPIGPDVGRFAHYLSQAHYLSGTYEDATAWGRVSESEAPANASNLRCLIASLVALGQTEEATHFAGRLLQLVPGFRLADFRFRTPLPEEVSGKFVERLGIAGVPE